MTNIDFTKLIESVNAELNEPPTVKQIKFAKDISKRLDIPLPDTKTKVAYKLFIGCNLDIYKKKLKSNKIGYCDDNPLGVPGVISNIDIYDLGISPWGSGFFED